METTPVDPRDTSWEVDHPTYRVLIWSPLPAQPEPGPSTQAWNCHSDDVTGADIGEVLSWARRQMPRNGGYTVFLRGNDRGEPGLCRLAGWEPTRLDAPPAHVDHVAP